MAFLENMNFNISKVYTDVEYLHFDLTKGRDKASSDFLCSKKIGIDSNLGCGNDLFQSFKITANVSVIDRQTMWDDSTWYWEFPITEDTCLEP